MPEQPNQLSIFAESFARAFNSPITWILVALIITVLLLGLMLCWRARQAVRELRALKNSLARFQAGQATVESVNEIESLLKQSPYTAEQWSEFKEGLEAVNGRVFNSFQSGDFFKDEPFLYSIRWWFIHFTSGSTLPNTATGLGVLGTFAGIAVGLGQLSVSSETSEKMVATIGQVIPPLAAAFWTSIIGVIVAIILSVSFQHYESALLGTFHDVLERIDRIFPRITSVRHVVRIHNELHQLNQRSAEVLQQQTEVARVLTEAADFLVDIRDTSTSAKDFLAEIALDFADKVTQGFQSVVQQHLLPPLESMTSAVQERAADTSQLAADEVRRMADEMLNSVTASMTGALGDVNRELEAVGDQVRGLTQAMTDSLQSSQSAAAEQRRLVEMSVNAVNQVQKQTHDASEQLAALQGFQGSAQQLLVKLNESLESVGRLQVQQDAIRTRSAEDSQRLQKVIGSSIGAYSQSAEQLQHLLPTLTKSVQSVQQAIVALNQAATTASTNAENAANRLAQAATAISQRVEKEQELVRAFGQASGGFAEAMSRATPVASKLERFGEVVEQQYSSLAATTQALSTLQERFASLRDSLAAGFTSSERALRESADTMVQAISQARDWADAASKALDSFANGMSEATSRSLANYDESLSRSVKLLTDATSGLNGFIDEVATLHEQLNTRLNGGANK